MLLYTILYSTEAEDQLKKQKYKDLINSYFSIADTDVVKNSKFSFKETMNKTMSAVVERFFEIIVFYFQKYPEAEFHRRMNNKYTLVDKATGESFVLDGFDFVKDFKTYHKAKYLASMMAVRANKRWFVFDEEKIYKILIGLLEVKGWVLLPHEKASIRMTVRRFKNIIYHNRDSIRDLDQK